MAKHTNRLIHETSPYLLQHAHNPVDWYPWGDEALNKAKKENKPILVSIGYAACHWCHVMERESFENEETARLMNEYFVNIKIDREERPDIDHIYMDAVQAMVGSGGWPLNVFLTPDCRPFYGGTYFPPERAYNRSSWKEVISAINQTYKEKKDEIEEQAARLTEHLKKGNAFAVGQNANTNASFTKNTLAEIAKSLIKSGDNAWGGFGKAPKFPQTFSIQFLLRHYHYTKDEAALNLALLSLDKMIYGGIYDHLGGGFARYSTDKKWLAPHFEKMLYDNALLIQALADAYQLTQKRLYFDTIRHTMNYIETEMLHPNGGFYSALDADSEGVEGKFYTWSKAEVLEILGEDGELFCEFYNILQHGNWEQTNILWITKPLEEFATEKGWENCALAEKFEAWKRLLLAERNKRIKPALDDKILLSWNALMNVACSKAYAATGDEKYRSLTVRNAAFLEASFVDRTTDRWLHTFKNGTAKYPAFLDDYAYLIDAYIHLQEITGEVEYLQKAKNITEIVLGDFEEEQTGLFFFTADNQRDAIVRKKEIYDGATPSGNSVMAANLMYLGTVFNNKLWIERGTKMVTQFSYAISRYPTSFANWAGVAQQIVYGIPEIAIAGKRAFEVLPKVLKEFIPFRVLQTSEKPKNEYPLLQGKSFEKEILIYVCKEYSCQKPVEKVEEIKVLLN